MNAFSFFRGWIHLTCTGLFFLLGLGSARADGELDLSFTPPVEFQKAIPDLRVFDGFLYLQNAGNPLQRLREDGSLDTTWRLNAPNFPIVQALAPTPFGDWVMHNLSFGYLESADGSFRNHAAVHNPWPIRDYFPQDDGTVVIHGLVQLAPDGTIIPAFARHRRLISASFNDGAGRAISGGINSYAVQDRQGRFIVVGNFGEAGGIKRLGLVRFLINGRPDPDWDPAPAVGITLSEANALNMLPFTVSLGPNDSVVVGLHPMASNGGPKLHLARISSDGTVEAAFKTDATPTGWHTPPIVQPDGRILVCGQFDQWGDEKVTSLVRLLPDGSLDPTFQVQLTHLTSESNSVAVLSMVHDETGRLWISGYFDQVNGVNRPGLARVFAWHPEPNPPSLQIGYAPARVGTNENLLLSAQVSGIPAPQFQWYRGDEPLPGATHRGLRLPVNAETDLGSFRLVTWNASGTNELEFPPVELAVRSPQPGVLDPDWERPLSEFTRVSVVLPTSDGKIVIGDGSWSTELSETPKVMLARLDQDGRLDPTFGDQGVLRGNGYVESLRLLPGGGLLVAGHFSQFADEPASGVVELDDRGWKVARAFPTLDTPRLSTVLPLPDGGYLFGGSFTRVGDFTTFNLARLKPDLTVDSTFQSPLHDWQGVDDLALDELGRALVAGGRVWNRSGEVLVNPPLTGLLRLRDDGSLDPEFQVSTGNIRTVFVEPGNFLLAGSPPLRMDADGHPLTAFEVRSSDRPNPFGPFVDHRLVRLPSGGAISVRDANDARELVRWNPDGTRDDHFSALLWERGSQRQIRALAVAPDGAVLVASSDPEGSYLHRLLPDSDQRLRNLKLVEGRFEAELASQPDRSYQIYRRATLGGGDEPLVEIEGDGYVRRISVPAPEDQLFLETRIP